MGYSVDKIIETDQGMNRIIRMTLGKEILEKISKWSRSTKDGFIEMDIEEIIGIRFMEEEGVGLEKDYTKTITEGMTKVIDLDQVQEQVPIEIE